MAEQPKFPVKIYHARPKGPAKMLTVKSQAELDGFLRCGWTTEEPK